MASRRRKWYQNLQQYHESVESARKEINKRINYHGPGADHDFDGLTIVSIKLAKKGPHGGPNTYQKPKGSRGRGRRLYNIVLRKKKTTRKKRRKK